MAVGERAEGVAWEGAGAGVVHGVGLDGVAVAAEAGVATGGCVEGRGLTKSLISISHRSSET